MRSWGGCAVTAVLQRKDISPILQCIPLSRLYLMQPQTVVHHQWAATCLGFTGIAQFRRMICNGSPHTVLELLAFGFTVMFGGRIRPVMSYQLALVDDTAAYYTLADESDKSEVLIEAHRALLNNSIFLQAISTRHPLDLYACAWRLPACRRCDKLFQMGHTVCLSCIASPSPPSL